MDKKLKIAIIGSRGYPYVYSGYETLVKELSERLIKKGHHVRVYCHSSLFIKKPKFVNGIELVYTPSVKSKIFSQLFNSFFSFIHVCFSEIDIVLVVNSANGPYGILTKLFSKKTCINVDGLEWLRPKWRGIGSTYFKFSSKLSTLFYDQIITDSEEMKKIYLNLFKADSEVISYGSPEIHRVNNELIHKWNLKKRGYYLIVGRLIPDNNADLIIKGILKSKTKKKIVVVGDVPYKDNYASSLKKISDNRLIFTNYVNDQNELVALYKNCHVYVHGHEFGGTNPTMIMALANNCCVLALNTVFNKEMLSNNEFGIFFNKRIESVIKMTNHCDNDTNMVLKYRNKSHNAITDKYNWDSISQAYINIFKKLINSSYK